MVKSCGNRYGCGVPEWKKLPQYREQATASSKAKDVEMEGIEVGTEHKLVLRRGLRRKRSRADSMFGSIDESPVKRNAQTLIHINRKKALHSASGFLLAALVRDAVTDSNNALPPPIDLTHEDPSLVKNYLEWVDTGKIATQKRPRWASVDEKRRPDYKEETTLDTEHLAQCYGFGERLKDVKYRNAILCTMRLYVFTERIFPSDRAVAIIYENTTKGSSARKLMVDF
ncbi:hypothetical protein BU23DRAFT_604415 [Bimuria novae-zelandiae CBS 107.79]|uniref:BTB domain-containing protein n=1 Tax=Bimuria novae-zelandiae CBS 107.79 TaxID=1447943 RepID=A0A6A5UVK1_9PLEO|nr:hypothetical protein BU23DRAFT_604415 [Bimuria novae-zelandiae CBS 107.79]